MKNDAGNCSNLINRNGTWHSDFVDPIGNRIRISLKTSDRRLAEMKLKKMQVIAFEKGQFDMKKPAKMRFIELAQKVLDYAKDRKRSYKKVYVPIMKHLIKFFGNKYLQEVTASLINVYQTERKEAVCPVTVNKEIGMLRICFNLAIRWGLFYSNPVKGVEFYKIPKSRIRFLNVEEINKLILSCRGYIRNIVLTALHTGGRKSEILNLRWDNIDLENRLVVFEQTKNDDVRQIPMTDTLYTMLTNMKAEIRDKEYLFVNKEGKPFGKVDKSFKNALRLAGIEDFRFHDLRHTFASQLVMSGADIMTIKELLGHRDLKTTLIYAHLAPKHKIEAVKNYENHLGKVIIYDTNMTQKAFGVL